ncbi:hypothetical protein LA080_012407 [Diaporthe eres]|nr:hypothetical protein LA080_012407 [Diaporthe eres]
MPSDFVLLFAAYGQLANKEQRFCQGALGKKATRSNPKQEMSLHRSALKILFNQVKNHVRVHRTSADSKSLLTGKSSSTHTTYHKPRPQEHFSGNLSSLTKTDDFRISNWQCQQNVALIILIALVSCAIYVIASADPFIIVFHSTLVATIKWCLSVADRVQEMGEGIFKGWQEADPQHRSPNFPAISPFYVFYALKSSDFAADVLRDAGGFLAAQVISYRSYGFGNPLTTSPARVVLASRSLFLPDQVLGVSTWVPKVWP